MPSACHICNCHHCVTEAGKRGDMILVYQILNGLLNLFSSPQQFSSPPEVTILKLSKQHFHKNIQIACLINKSN